MKKKEIPFRKLSALNRREIERVLMAKRIRSWKSQLDGCLRFLEGVTYQDDIHGRKWVDRMVAYYGAKADELLLIPPVGCAKVVPHYKRRLRELRSRVYTRKSK